MVETTSRPAFELQFVGVHKMKVVLDKHATINCDFTVKDRPKSDLIIIPGFDIRYLPDLDFNYYNGLAEWLVEEHRKGAVIGSMCLGAALLAHSGLLKNGFCTTHWAGHDFMKCQYAEVNMATSEIITHNNDIYTSGGAFSSIQLILFFIEKYCGREAATYISKMAAMPYPLKSQNQFYIFNKQKHHQDKAIETAQEYMEDRYQKAINLQDLSGHVNMSARNFIRRFKKATGDTPVEYLQKIRIEVAKKSFEEGNNSVSDVMYSSGYQDIKSFGALFKRMTGMTPSVYSKRYQSASRF